MNFSVLIGSVMMFRGFTRALQQTFPPFQNLFTNFATSAALQDAIRETVVPKVGIMDVEDGLYTSAESSLPELPFQFKPQTSSQLFQSRFGLWRQAPWKKIKGKVIIRAKFGGSLPLETAAESIQQLFAGKDTLSLQSFNELTSLCILGAYDPRIKAIFLELGPLGCGYAKIDEMIRLLSFFRASGKPVVGYATGAGMKEYYLSRAFDEFYLPPEGQLTLNGFSSQSNFIRGALEKIGVEPEVRFIGKYKSFGESLIRKNMSEAQRESTSLILNELSDRWAAKVASSINKTHDEVTKLWTEVDSLSPYDYKERGFITGVMYKDQVEKKLQDRLTTPKSRSIFNRIVNFFLTNKDSNKTNSTSLNESGDYDLRKDFENQPRRQVKTLTAEELKAMQNKTKVIQKQEAKAAKLTAKPEFFPVQTYLSKMKKGFRILQGLPVNFGIKYGPRVAVINAFGGISQGKSGNSPTGGRSVGADSIVELIKKARLDNNIKAVVLRVDSPGGDALASDLVWREVRALSKAKPVVASMVDTAASGGYYFSMACDQIVAEQATLTGSIGVVLAALKWPKLNQKLDINVEVLSIGRYPSILIPDKAFTPEEEQYFDAQAKQAYLDFTTKAAASRSMPLETLQEVAQGRVWFGRQALKRGLVDKLGGLWTAVDMAYDLAHMKPNINSTNNATFKYNVEILRDRSAGAFAAALGGASSAVSATNGRVMALASDEVFNMNLVSEESLGGSPVLSELGLNAQLAMLLKSSPEAKPFFRWLEQGEKLGGVRNLWNIVTQRLGL